MHSVKDLLMHELAEEFHTDYADFAVAVYKLWATFSEMAKFYPVIMFSD